MPKCNKYTVNVSYLPRDYSRNSIVGECGLWRQFSWVYITTIYYVNIQAPSQLLVPHL